MKEPSEADKKYFIKQQYFYRIHLKFSWIREALTLKLAADRLYGEYKHAHDEFMEWMNSDKSPEEILNDEYFTRDLILNFYKIYFMLMGYAFENLFKGILTGQKPPVSLENNFPYKSHSLEQLAEKIDIELEGSEKDLLKQLGEYVKWKGRYPFPIRLDQMPQFDKNGVWQEGYSHDDKHKVDIDNLFNKIIYVLSKQKNLFKSPNERS